MPGGTSGKSALHSTELPLCSINVSLSICRYIAMSQGHQRTRRPSLLLGHSKSCPKGFLIQTPHFFPPANGSYTASENSRNSFQQCQHKQAAAPGTLSVHTSCSSCTQSSCSLSQEHSWQHSPLSDSTDTHGGTTVLYVGLLCGECTGHNLDLSQGIHLTTAPQGRWNIPVSGNTSGKFKSCERLSYPHHQFSKAPH